MSAVPAGMTAEKLEKIADYVSLLDRMDFDPDGKTVTIGPARTDETEMQDDLRAWAAHLRVAAQDEDPHGDFFAEVTT